MDGQPNELKLKEYAPWGIYTFAAFDAYKAAQNQAREVQDQASTLMNLIYNVVNDDQVQDKVKALTALIDEFSARVKKMEAGETSNHKETNEEFTWTGFLTNKEITYDASSLNGLADRFSADASLVGSDRVAVKRRLREAYGSLQLTPPHQVKALDDDFMVWKEDGDGPMRWMAVYSNNFRDDDFPAEIISEKSHQAFTELANEGLLPMPELWQWHIPGTRWGEAKGLAYFDGFSVAVGEVDPGHEKEAELLVKMGDIRVSHGMPKRHILRNGADPSVIDFAITKEISTLPRHAAANKLTGFTVDKEQDFMALSDKKKEFLKNLGYGDEQLAQIEATVSKLKSQGEGEGRETKEATPATPTPEPEKPSGEKPPVEEPTLAAMTLKELAEQIGAVLKPITEKQAAMEQTLSDLKGQLGQSAQTAQQVEKALKVTPRMSLAEMVSLQFNQPTAQIDGRKVDGPVENKEGLGVKRLTGVPFLDQAIANARSAV